MKSSSCLLFDYKSIPLPPPPIFICLLFKAKFHRLNTWQFHLIDDRLTADWGTISSCFGSATRVEGGGGGTAGRAGRQADRQMDRLALYPGPNVQSHGPIFFQAASELVSCRGRRRRSSSRPFESNRCTTTTMFQGLEISLPRRPVGAELEWQFIGKRRHLFLIAEK